MTSSELSRGWPADWRPKRKSGNILASMMLLDHQHPPLPSSGQYTSRGFLAGGRHNSSRLRLLRHTSSSAGIMAPHLMNGGADPSDPSGMQSSSSSDLGVAHKATAAAVAGSSRAGGGNGVGGSASGSRSVSLASVSSDGSASSEQSHLVEQEDIVALTQEVRAFKEALGRLRRLFSDSNGKDGLRGAAHERLGEVLRILRIILERYPALQSTELLVAAGSLIHQVKEHPYEDDKGDVREFMESIDQLALAFSSRVSEYLMGDLDSNISLASSVSSKTKSCENLPSDVENGVPAAEGVHHHKTSTVENATASAENSPSFSGSQMDAVLLQLEQGVEVALHRAKLWSKYAKDIMTYVEKRCNLEIEFAKNVAKLAQTMKSALKEECYLPFQSIYITAMDREIDSSNSVQSTTSLLTGHKFLEPLSARRNEHERCRKQIKETWHRELKRMQESVSNLRKAKSLYIQRQQEWERAKEAAQRAETAAAELAGDQAAKIDKRKKTEEDALQKAMEAEAAYKASVCEANERHGQLLRVKAQVLQQVRELMLQCDQTMKAVTVSYFQLQHTVSAPSPVQFQTLCESSRLYEPGSQYLEFIKRMPLPSGAGAKAQPGARDGTPAAQAAAPGPYTFEPYSEECTTLEKERKSNGSLSADSNDSTGKERAQGPMKAWSASAVASGGPSSASGGNNIVTQVSSDNESVESSPSAKSRETSPTASPMMPARRLVPASSGDELENEPDPEVEGGYMGYSATRRHCMSKAAVTHTFRKLRTPSRCRECDSYVYFQGAECVECGLGCHKKCLESLTIQCGHKRLPRKMTTFGVDLSQHLAETGTQVPHLLAKCIGEIDQRGIQVKGLYRVSGVKSKVEKLCQSFENGAELIDLTDTHPNVIANVLKLYLRQLPEALLTSRLYPDFIRVAREWAPGEGATPARLEELRELVHRLPRQHFNTLAFLMHHLKRVANESELNNMPASNLGIVFGPTLLRTSEGSASLSSLVDTVHQTRVIELLIDHAEAVFGPAEPLQSASRDSPAHRASAAQASAAEGGASGPSSLLSKVPVVRSISFLEKHRSKSRESDPSNIVRHSLHSVDVREEVILPGFVADSTKTPNTSLDIDPLSEEGLLGPTSDDDLPDFLLPDDSNSKPRKLPGYLRTSTAAPKIFKSSLKDYHGLEGVDLNLLSSQDHEVHPVTPSRGKKSITDPVGTSNPPPILQDHTESSSLTVQTTSSVVKTSSLTPFMDSSIDSDHSWESHSTGSSGRGTQHSDQGSLGSTQRALLLAGHHDEPDGGRAEPFASLPSQQVLNQHKLSHDENRVKIQVPSATAWSSANTSTSVPPALEPRGVVTVVEGPQSCTTLVESITSESTNKITTTTTTTTGGGRNAGAAAALVVSDLAAVSVGLTHEFAHVFGRSAPVKNPPMTMTSTTTTTTNPMDSASASGSSSGGGGSMSPDSKKPPGERLPRFV